MDYWLPIIVLFGAFFFMLALGVPIVYAIGLSTLASISTQLDFNSALSVVSQKLASGLDSFTLLAIPFFILSGNIMNHGGIARRLINFARILGGRLPGSLAGNDSNLLIVFYVQIMPDDFVMQLHRF
ncbi:TRAP transporter subunit DctM [Escherichia coli]|nr:TRAP transporter, DctM subunit [Escherichia coli P12b]STH08131.1 TRAP transporter subunit DctM [Escherichia coli]